MSWRSEVMRADFRGVLVSSKRKWKKILVDGDELTEDYGISLRYQPRDSSNDIDIYQGSDFFIAPAELVIWLTKRNQKGEYEEHQQLAPDVSLRWWDENGSAWELEGSVLVMIEENPNLGKEYEDDE
jgi:hypothetical protein